MKKLICLLLAMMCLLAGCRSAGRDPQDQASQPSESKTTVPADTDPTETTETEPTADATVILPDNNSGSILLGQTQKLRISYNGNRSGVRYVTDPSQLPDYPELEGYDEAYFADRALLLVVETVASGSVKVDIQSVTVDNGVAYVVLDHEIPTGMSTADMTTWLLWVEVDTGLEYTWNLVNPALPAQNQQHEQY